MKITRDEERQEITNQLAIVEDIQKSLAEVETVSEAVELRSKAEALRIYARSSGQLMSVQNRCAEMRLRLERKTGQLLIDHGRGPGNPQLSLGVTIVGTQSLRDLGINKNQSAQWQKIARIPLNKFEDFLSFMREGQKELTTAAALLVYKENARTHSKVEILKQEPAAVTSAGHIIHGNMLEVLDVVCPVNADLIVADPPYGLGETADIAIQGRENFSKPAGEWDDPNVAGLFGTWAAMFRRSVRDTASLYCFVCDFYVPLMWRALQQAGFVLRELLVWKKSNPPPSVRKANNRSDVEYIIYATAGEDFTFNWLGQNRMLKCKTFPICGGKERLDHPTQKPAALLREYIETSSNVGDLVLDPFAGVGSTGAAAADLGRRYLLIERDDYYYKQACLRLQDTTQPTARVF